MREAGTTMSGGFTVTTDYYDTDNDGVTDAQLIDADGDHVADEERYDVNGDGVTDVVYLDLNGDGVSDYTEYAGPFPTA
ncbi:hypothetical protein [Planobispora takensis]|nr:hypothetical protein [Planobispora takensis]